MAIGHSDDDDYGDGYCLHPPLARPLVGWWVVCGYSRGLALVLVMMGDVEVMTIVMALVMMMIMVMVRASPSTSRPVQWVVWGYKRQ